MSLTRRAFLKAALAAPLAQLIVPGRRTERQFDVVIVGAGIAGLAAANVLLAGRLKTVVLEARNRPGGRTYTRTFAGVPVDLGGQWFHQSDDNPLLKNAKAHGYSLVPQSDPLFYVGSHRSTPQEAAPAIRLWSEIDHDIEEAGKSAQAGALDVSAARATSRLAQRPWYKLDETILGPLDMGANFSAFSSEDFYNYALIKGGDTMIAGGMGAFVASFSRGVPIALSAPVSLVKWDRKEGVELHTPTATIRAHKVIITVPFGVLAAGTIAFSPPLPSAYRDLIGDLPMGNFEKIFLSFSKQVFPLPVNALIYPMIDKVRQPGIQAPLWNGSVALCFTGGELARELVSKGSVAMVSYAKEQVVNIFGNDILRHFEGALTSDWLNDRWSCGSYTYAKPGDATARQLLAQPLNDQIFFAGEALSVKHPQTIAGAYLSGIAAANRALNAAGTLASAPVLANS